MLYLARNGKHVYTHARAHTWTGRDNGGSNSCREPSISNVTVSESYLRDSEARIRVPRGTITNRTSLPTPCPFVSFAPPLCLVHPRCYRKDFRLVEQAFRGLFISHNGTMHLARIPLRKGGTAHSALSEYRIRYTEALACTSALCAYPSISSRPLRTSVQKLAQTFDNRRIAYAARSAYRITNSRYCRMRGSALTFTSVRSSNWNHSQSFTWRLSYASFTYRKRSSSSLLPPYISFHRISRPLYIEAQRNMTESTSPVHRHVPNTHAVVGPSRGGQRVHA